MKHILYLIPFTLMALPATAQKLAPSALHAARQHQVIRAGRVKSAAPQETVSAFIRISDSTVIPELEARGIVVRSNIKDRILTANVPIGALEAIAELEGVERVELGAEVRKNMDLARADAGADRVRSIAEGLDRAYKGKGVIVGVVDQGFEYSHIAFKGEDGITPRIQRAWNQKYTSTAEHFPQGFTYGTEYLVWSDLNAVGCDFQYDTYHGSHVTNIAAGADMKSPYYGIASESELVLVTYDTTADQIVDGVKYIFDYAEQQGKPCVINLSIGMHTGPHDGSSLTDQALDALTGPGRIIVGAVGNEGTSAMHVGKTVTPDDPLKVIPAFYDEATKQFVCDFWGDVGKTYFVQPVVVNSLKGNIVAYGTKVSSADVADIDDSFTMSADGLTGVVNVTSVHDLDNGRGNFYISGKVDAQGTGRMLGLVFTTEEGDCVVNGWNCYYKDFTANANCQKQGFTPGDANSLASEIGGTAHEIISVGSYNTRLNYTNIEQITYAMGGPEYKKDNLSPFSSNGPTADGRMKPEVCAPGFCVISAAQRHAINTGTCAAVSRDEKGNNYYYEVTGGTSMAAPYVTGSIALWLEANPSLTPADIRNILRASSRRDQFTGTLCTENDESAGLPTGDNRWGYGKIDTFAGLICAANYDPTQMSIALPTLDAAQNLRASYDRDSHQLHIFQKGAYVEIFNTAGRLVLRTNSAHNADLSNLPAGTYILRLTYGQSVATQKLLIN